MSKNDFKTNLSVSSRGIFQLTLAITAILLVIHLVLQLLFHVFDVEIMSTLRGRFDVDNEISIPTWYAQILLFLPAVLCFAIYKIKRLKNLAYSWYWLLLGGFLLFLSVDEGAMLHEAFITKFRELTTDNGASGILNHLWLIPVLMVLLLLAVPFVKFLRNLDKRIAKLLALGLGVFFFGAVVYETIGLMLVSSSGGFLYEGLNVAIEEGLEFLGASIILYGLLEEIRRESPSTTLQVTK